jgi:GntP family gluconate:H+ symporter
MGQALAVLVMASDRQPKPRFIYDISRYSAAADRPGQRVGAGRLIVSRIKLHPLLALLIVSIGVGFATGMAPAIVKQLTNGAGKTLGAVGVVIALGAMLGKILAGHHRADCRSHSQARLDRMIPWAMTLVAFIVGIPMFFEVGLVVMLPLIFSVARKLEGQARFKGSAYVYVGCR